MHDEIPLGETCPDCGTHHRVVESIPSQPLTRSLVDDLRRSTTFTFVQATNWSSGKHLGLDTDEEVTEDLILGTETKAMYLRLYDPGWVVELEADPREDVDETVEDVAQEMWMYVSQERDAELFEMLEFVCSLLDPEYDCPECEYRKTGGTTSAHNFLSHLTDTHGYTGEEALSILEDCALNAELTF